MNHKNYPLVVIGAGAGGLVVAIGAARTGRKVLLIEKGHYGGDCTNFGCIPSKSLIATADISHALKLARTFGQNCGDIDTSLVLERVRNIRQRIRSHEEPETLQERGVDVITGTASFRDPHTLEVQGSDGTTHIITAGQIVIATGSHPFIPPIDGIESCSILTNETIFEIKKAPKSLAVLGGGPIGCELAQAFSRLGTKVTLIHSHKELLGKEEPEAQELIAKQFAEEGIDLKLGYHPQKMENRGDTIAIDIKEDESGIASTISAEKVLISTGRRPTVADLKLENAQIDFSPKGIPVDLYGRTNQKHIWAVGDVTGGPLFTHAAENQARSVLASLLLPGPFKKKIDRKQSIPRATYTDPEIASVGLLENEVYKHYSKTKISVYTIPMSEVDRAICAGREEGFVKVIVHKYSSKILGATVAAPRAGEMLMQLSTAMHNKIPLRKLSGLIFPYPIYSFAVRRAADLWLTETLTRILHRK